MTSVAKIVEIIGSSDKSWQDAAQAVLNEAKKTYMKYMELRLWI